MIARSKKETIAYVQGYNNSFEMFEHILLQKYDIETAIDKMEIYVAAVNAVIDKEEKNDSN